MTDRIEKIRAYYREKKHHQYRQVVNLSQLQNFTYKMAVKDLPYIERAALRLCFVLENETPRAEKDAEIIMQRTFPAIPNLFTTDEWQQITENHYIHEKGQVCNVCPDYAPIIESGLDQIRLEALNKLSKTTVHKERNFLLAVIASIDAVLNLCNRYAEVCDQVGNSNAAERFRRVPLEGAKSFHDALQFFRILHFALWAAGNYHNTIGRFDQYMMPYLKADLDDNNITVDQAFELLEEFYISFNIDSDLYPGMQQGDNGQSIVLGGLDENGCDACNLLTELCLKASLELCLIDPKINIRVNSNTNLQWFELGSLLTSKGLGFPQYSNDDVVIPGLINKGYTPRDARKYAVAACWEFIIPGKGMDIPNIGAICFPQIVNETVHEYLDECHSFDDLRHVIKININNYVTQEVERYKNIFMEPSPFLSIFMNNCLTNARDISEGGIYNNFGIHGTGLSNAVDSLAAINKLVFQNESVSKKQLLDALKTNFQDSKQLQAVLRYDAPKMGNDDDETDELAGWLLKCFSAALEGIINERGGIYRAGTGSAMYYVWHSRNLPATADGRSAGEYISANYAPSLNIKTKGPISIIRSFTKPDLQSAINGGPLTIEIHDSVFRNKESIKKVAWLVKSFIIMGGHQLQLNAVNKDTLLKAQINPAQYRDLIVRVWGWSGYFIELDKEYQDQIIQRVELNI